jgi:hypothetical protein
VTPLILVIAFGALIVVLVIGHWLIPLVFGYIDPERMPGWALPIIIPILAVFGLRIGLGNEMVTRGYYVFVAVLGAVTGLLAWMGKRQRLASFKRRFEAWTEKSPSSTSIRSRR